MFGIRLFEVKQLSKLKTQFFFEFTPHVMMIQSTKENTLFKKNIKRNEMGKKIVYKSKRVI